MNGSLWNSQGVGQHCISCKNRLIYHHSVYSDNILLCFSQGCDFWYEASHCLQHIVETPVTLQDYFFQKMPVLSWQTLFGTLTCQFLLLYSAKKVPCIYHGSVYHSCKESPPPFLWPNVNSLHGHKLIKQINTTHLLVAVLKRFRHWYTISFLGWLWSTLSFADRITGNIIGGTSNNYVIQRSFYQIFTIGNKITGSSRFLC